MSSYDVDRPQLKVGVLMENAQLSDMAFVDILDQLSLPHVQAVAAYGMAEFLPLAIDMQWHYIASSLEPAVLAPAVRFVPTHTYDSAPHDLDIIFVGGVPVSFRPAAATVFLQKAVPRAKAVFTTCLGSLWLASAGLLKDRNATTNRLALTASRDMFPETKWQEQRWVVDGNIWSAGGPGAGELRL